MSDFSWSNRKNNSTACRLYNIQCRYFYFHRYTKQNIFLYTIISNGEYDLISFRGTESPKDISLVFASASFSGPGGNRTRVQTGIPCTSTIIVHFFTFPPPDENEHPSGFSSFMIRPCTQSLMHVVSYIVDAWVLKCRCLKSDSCH